MRHRNTSLKFITKKQNSSWSENNKKSLKTPPWWLFFISNLQHPDLAEIWNILSWSFSYPATVSSFSLRKGIPWCFFSGSPRMLLPFPVSATKRKRTCYDPFFLHEQITVSLSAPSMNRPGTVTHTSAELWLSSSTVAWHLNFFFPGLWRAKVNVTSQGDRCWIWCWESSYIWAPVSSTHIRVISWFIGV